MFLKLYFIALPVFLLIDGLWLGLIAKNFYAKQIGFLMKTNINWFSALLFYVLFIIGLVVFVLLPTIKSNSWQTALLLGCLLGFICYATYDLTNLATLKNWPVIVTIVDIIWGTVLGGSVSLITYFLSKIMFRL